MSVISGTQVLPPFSKLSFQIPLARGTQYIDTTQVFISTIPLQVGIPRVS